MGHHPSSDTLVQRRVQWDESSRNGMGPYKYGLEGPDREGTETIQPVRRKARASDGLPLPLWLTNTFFAISFVLSSYYLLGRWRVKIEASEKLHHLSWTELVAVILDMSSFIYLISFCGIGYVQNSVANLDSDDDEPVSSEMLMPSRPCLKMSSRAGGPLLSLNSPLSSPFSSMESLTPPTGLPPSATHMHYPPPPAQSLSSSDGLSLGSSSSGMGLVTPEKASAPKLARVAQLSPMHGDASHAGSSPASVNSHAVQEAGDRPAASALDAADEELVRAVVAGEVASHSLESRLGDAKKAALVRRRAVEARTGRSLEGLPLEHYDYEVVRGACCEMVVGHVQIPVGVAGPLALDGQEFFVPMATTEGCLVASTNRGCKAILESGGASSVVYRDGMTRAPAVQLPSAVRAAALRNYLEDPGRFEELSTAFNSTSRFARLQSIRCAVAGRYVYIRFCCSTGDAMGMNMISKGVQCVLSDARLRESFPDMRVVSISGNFCADKKPTAVNWIEGRGKSVVCEAVIPAAVLKKVLKTSAQAMVELNTAKNLIGSAMAGAVGGFNAHASNIVTAVYLATGQDPAQNVESSQCITVFEAVKCEDGQEDWDLHASVSMPSIEVGTVGGGTFLAPQAAMLNLLGVKGAHPTIPGENARQLAKVVAGAVLAGELSLMSALATGHLVSSHLKYNRSSTNLASAAAAAVAAVGAQPGTCTL